MTKVDKDDGGVTPPDPITAITKHLDTGKDATAVAPGTPDGTDSQNDQSGAGAYRRPKEGKRPHSSVFDLLSRSNDPLWDDTASATSEGSGVVRTPTDQTDATPAFVPLVSQRHEMGANRGEEPGGARLGSTPGIAHGDVATGSVATEAGENPSRIRWPGRGRNAGQRPPIKSLATVDGNGSQTEVADPEVETPEATPGDGPTSTPEPTNLDRTGWEVVREGIRETGHGTGIVVRSGWTKMRAKLPGAHGSLGLAAWLVGALVVVVVVVAVAADVLQQAPSVVVTTASPATINAQPGGVGTTTAAQNLSFSVGLNITGVTAPVTVTGVNVINGSRVEKGQTLLSLDPTTLEQNVATVQDLLNSAELGLLSAEFSPGSGSLYPIASLQGEVAVDQQLLAIAQGNSTTIDAPLTGWVTSLSVQPGQAVRPGTTMLQIVDTSRINVTAGLQLNDMQAVQVGQPADIVPTGLVGVHLPGTVVAINPVATGGGLQGSVVIAADNLASNPLPIGTQVFVRITAIRRAAVSVPAIAVQNLDLAPAVFVVSHGRVYVKPVTVGAVDANRVQILSGLSAGQGVAESNTQLLTNGERVTTTG